MKKDSDTLPTGEGRDEQSILQDAVAHYDATAEQFARETAELDLTHAYDKFLPHIPVGGSILDAGCGAGRDAKRFADMGYRVEGFDASEEMVRLASEHTGVPIRHTTFADMDYQPRFDGVFASASLLHLPPRALPGALRNILAALKPGGVLYAGFKHGDAQWAKGKLYFCAWDEQRLSKACETVPGLHLTRTWTTPDLRPGRGDELWLHCIAVKD